jgi:hypothetical protein
MKAALGTSRARALFSTMLAAAALMVFTGQVFAASPDPIVVGAFASIQDAGAADVAAAMPVIVAFLILGIGITLLVKLGKKAPRAL